MFLSCSQILCKYCNCYSVTDDNGILCVCPRYWASMILPPDIIRSYCGADKCFWPARIRFTYPGLFYGPLTCVATYYILLRACISQDSFTIRRRQFHRSSMLRELPETDERDLQHSLQYLLPHSGTDLCAMHCRCHRNFAKSHVVFGCSAEDFLTCIMCMFESSFRASGSASTVLA